MSVVEALASQAELSHFDVLSPRTPSNQPPEASSGPLFLFVFEFF
jgi:hypothetical protein